MLRRFAWKEYRTLRGFWLAVLLLGLLVQWLVGVFLPPQPDWPTLRLYVALAAATLYAAGAAAILFSIEHEDGTFDFLSGLPATWLPVFVGKLLLAAASAIALAASLALAGFMAGGSFHLPSANNAALAFGIFGIAILEAIAWGTLFSLLFKRPLAAAIMTLVIGALATHIAVNATSSNLMASADPQAYVSAIPLRLAIVIAVFACSILAARRWIGFSWQRGTTDFLSPSPRRGALDVLFPSPRRGGARGGGIPTGKDWFKNPYGLTTVLLATLNVFRPLTNRLASKANRGRRVTMLARLLWQSWRESWKWLPVPLIVGVALTCTIGTLFGIWTFSDSSAYAIAATTCFVPALYGALAFSADQRRGQVRFLTEHAAAPRYVWLARHIVWLGTFLMLCAAVVIALTIAAAFGLQTKWQRMSEYESGWIYQPSYMVAQELFQAVTSVLTGGALASLGTLTAYAMGQLCSMLLRSEILAAFVALVLAVVLSAWVAVLFLWDLSGWLFLFPLAAGLLLATWLRAPAWVAGRNSWRAWVKPALAVIVPFVLIAFLLPQLRLAQVWNAHVNSQIKSGKVVSTPEGAVAWKQFIAQAEETAQMYQRAADMLHTPLPDSPLEPWSGPEYAEAGLDGFQGGIDEKKIPADQRDAFNLAKEKWGELLTEAHVASIKLAIEASQHPTCQFTFNLSPTKLEPYNRRNNLRLEPDKTYEALNDLLTSVTASQLGMEITLDRLLAGLRMSAHLRSRQPSAIFIRQLRREQEILQRIGQWAASNERTNDERRDAIEKLQTLFRSRRSELAVALGADQNLIREVIKGKEPPLVLAEEPVSNATYMAFLANELPWERERALQALDIITTQNTFDFDELTEWLRKPSPNNMGSFNLRRWLQPGSQYPGAIWQTPLMQAAATSYLLRFEYDARFPLHDLFREYLDTETSQRAVLIEIALAMYRKDHGEYPQTLAALVPEYLDHEPLDPYSQQPFHYVPGGLDAPLASYFRRGEIEPGTPLFWSVGPYNARLIRSERDVSNRNETDLGAERVEDMKPYYRLNEEYYYDSHRPSDLVFPLPK